MQKTRGFRYVLFGLMCVCIVVGIATHSYKALAILMACGMIAAIIGDFIENQPSLRYRVHNHMHKRHQKETQA